MSTMLPRKKCGYRVSKGENWFLYVADCRWIDVVLHRVGISGYSRQWSKVFEMNLSIWKCEPFKHLEFISRNFWIRYRYIISKASCPSSNNSSHLTLCNSRFQTQNSQRVTWPDARKTSYLIENDVIPHTEHCKAHLKSTVKKWKWQQMMNYWQANYLMLKVSLQ